jgi:hypothetical protein
MGGRIVASPSRVAPGVVIASVTRSQAMCSRQVVALSLLFAALALASVAASGAEQQPIAPQRLVPILPAPPEHWCAEQVNVETASPRPGETQSMASRSYARTWVAGQPSVDVAIRDAGPSEVARAALRAEIDHDCARLGDDCHRVEGDRPGHLADLKESQASELSIVVGDRFVVQMWGASVPASTLEEWLKRMPLDRLEALGR